MLSTHFLATTSLTGLLKKDATNRDPGRVINISSVSSMEAMSESVLSAEGQGTWSCACHFFNYEICSLF